MTPWDRAHEIELEADADMALAAELMGKDKCVVVGCMTLIEPANNRDGFCSFHRRDRERAS